MSSASTDTLAERFEESRGHLRAVAYRMLGSLSEAEDAVQETWLRLQRSDISAVENLGGWLTTVTGRICLDLLRSRKARGEEPLETHVPDPLVTSLDTPDPEQQALQADSVGLALLVVLDSLAPVERLAFVLHDLFAVPFDDIAPIVERTPAATRQLASRARRRVQERRLRRRIPYGSARSWRRSSRRPAKATSNAWSRSWTRTCCYGRTPARRASRAWSEALTRWRPGRSRSSAWHRTYASCW